MPSTVFKKQSPNGKITVYLSSRELVHADGEVKPIDGVVCVEAGYLKDRHLYTMIILNFRYGREDEEVMGLKFYTEAVLDFKQLVNSNSTSEDSLSSLQRSLINKLGSEAYPLTVKVTPSAPPSVRLQPARPYAGSPLGVHYDLKVYVASRPEERSHKRSTIRMSLRCVQYAPPDNRLVINPPCERLSKTYVFSPGRLEVEAALNKDIYYQGDPLHVHVTVNNNSSKTVHRIKINVVQHVNVCMFTNGRFKNIVATANSDEGHPITSGSSFSRDFCLRLLSSVKFPVALAVDTGFHDEWKYLSSTTALPQKDKNPYGVVVYYEVKVKLVLGCIDRPLCLRLPFKLMHLPPQEGEIRGISADYLNRKSDMVDNGDLSDDNAMIQV